MSAAAAASELVAPLAFCVPSVALIASAAAWARSAERLPMMTLWPLWAQRRASPPPSLPVPPSTAIEARVSDIGEMFLFCIGTAALARRGLDERSELRRGEPAGVDLGVDLAVERGPLARNTADRTDQPFHLLGRHLLPVPGAGRARDALVHQ